MADYHQHRKAHATLNQPNALGEDFLIRQKPPLVTAVMITGKNPARRALARVAADCFLQQTYPEKELLIVSDSEDALGLTEPRVRELRFHKSQSVTLGNLRNQAIEEAHGEWIIQWDDDDWHAPQRIEVQMQARQEGAAVLLERQIRYCFRTRSAFVYQADRGICGTILHQKETPFRYPNLHRREDFEFMKQFRQQVVVNNDPGLYVRFAHGLNTWSEEHIMQNLAGKFGEVRLDEPHRMLLFGQVLPLYAYCSRAKNTAA